MSFVPKSLLLTLLLSSLLALPVQAGKLATSRTFSLDTGYIPILTSARAFWQFGLEFEHFGNWIFDLVDEKTFIGGNPATRLLWGAAIYFGWAYPQESFFVSNHEMGHGARSVAQGGSPSYSWNNSSQSHGNIFTFFLEGFTTSGGAVTTTPPFSASIILPDNYSVAVTAAGVNNSQLYSEYLEDEAYYNSGHIMHWIGYVRGKMDLYRYSRATEVGGNFGVAGAGDISNMLTSYSGFGYSIDTSDLKTGSLVSRLASFTHWAYVYSAIRYIVNGDPNVNSLEIGAVRLPDVSHYLLRRGISYKIRSGLNFKDVFIPFAVEMVYKGDKALELSGAYRKVKKLAGSRSGAFEIGATLNTVGGFGVKISSDFAVSNAAIMSLGGSVYHPNSFEGERNIARLVATGLGIEAWTRFSFVY